MLGSICWFTNLIWIKKAYCWFWALSLCRSIHNLISSRLVYSSQRLFHLNNTKQITNNGIIQSIPCNTIVAIWERYKTNNNINVKIHNPNKCTTAPYYAVTYALNKLEKSDQQKSTNHINQINKCIQFFFYTFNQQFLRLDT